MPDTLTTRGALAETEAFQQACRMACLKKLRTMWAASSDNQKPVLLERLARPPAVAAARYVAATAPLEGDDTITDANLQAATDEFLANTVPVATP